MSGLSRQIEAPGPAEAPSPSANMAVLQSFFAMIGTGSTANLGLFVTDDVECSIFGYCGIPMRTHAVGREAMMELIAHNFALVTHEQAPEVNSILAQGDVIVLTGIERGRLARDLSPYDAVFCQEYRFSHCKISSFRQIVAPNVCVAPP